MLELLRWVLLTAAVLFGLVYLVLGLALVGMGYDGLRYPGYASRLFPCSALVLGAAGLGTTLLCAAAIWALLP